MKKVWDFCRNKKWHFVQYCIEIVSDISMTSSMRQSFYDGTFLGIPEMGKDNTKGVMFDKTWMWKKAGKVHSMLRFSCFMLVFSMAAEHILGKNING